MDKQLANPMVVGLVIAVIVVAMTLSSCFTMVGPGERGVLMTFGAVKQGVLDPGLHFKMPFMQSVKLMDVRIQKSEAQQSAASLDLQEVTTTVAVNWSIDPADAEWVYQQIGDESALVDKVIEPAVANAVKAITAQYNAEELVEKRDAVRAQIERQIVAALAAFKVKVEGVNITDFSFSPEYTKAIEQKQVAQQRAQQAEYDLQRAKIEAQQKVAEAQGQAEAQKLLQSSVTPKIIEWQAVQKWNGVLPQVTSGQAVPFLGQALAAQDK